MNAIKIGLVFILVCSFVHAQDTIQGMYSYTYGDNESLVEARQTCKDLALRDAIESYYLFIESSTTVENAMLKEDLIQSIATGYLSDVQIAEQEEADRTITMTVTATVKADEVQSLVAARAASQQPSSEQIKQTQPQGDTDFFDKMDQFENQTQTAMARAEKQDVRTALNKRRQLMDELDLLKPLFSNQFQYAIYQCIRQRMQVQEAMARLRYYRSNKRTQQVRNQVKTLQSLNQILKKKTEALQAFQNLSKSNTKIQTTWVKRCQETLSQSKHILTAIKRR